MGIKHEIVHDGSRNSYPFDAMAIGDYIEFQISTRRLVTSYLHNKRQKAKGSFRKKFNIVKTDEFSCRCVRVA